MGLAGPGSVLVAIGERKGAPGPPTPRTVALGTFPHASAGEGELIGLRAVTPDGGTRYPTGGSRAAASSISAGVSPADAR